MVAGEIKRVLDAHLGRNVPPSSVYNLSHRHNWRKLAPYKRHPQTAGKCCEKGCAAEEIFQLKQATADIKAALNDTFAY
jgi:hypothetical protein